MKIVAIMASYLIAALLVVPGVAANDPEPLGASAGLYLFSALSAVACSVGFSLSVGSRSINREWVAAWSVAMAAPVVSAAAFWLMFASLGLGSAWVTGSAAAAGVGAAIPCLFRAAPNNSFKPKPLRGSA